MVVTESSGNLYYKSKKKACRSTNRAASVHQPYLCSVLWLCSKWQNSSSSLLHAFVPVKEGRMQLLWQ